MQCQHVLNADLLSAATKAYAERLREAVTRTFLLLEGQFLLTGQLSGQPFTNQMCPCMLCLPFSPAINLTRKAYFSVLDYYLIWIPPDGVCLTPS